VLAILGVAALPANASVHDYDNIYDRDVRDGSTVVHLYPKVDAHHLASYAYVKWGHKGVQARAKCARRNGNTHWYESTIYVKAGGGSSHYDCDNNGTFNYALRGLGADIH
jgi:hypothetical protein